jgi:hypothetical protein
MLALIFEKWDLGSLPSGQHEAFLEIVGGIAALAVREDWLEAVVANRIGDRKPILLSLPVKKADEKDSIKDTFRQSIKPSVPAVNFLHVVGCALSGKGLRYKSLYISQSQHSGGPAIVPQGISARKRQTAWKEFLISWIMSSLELPSETASDYQIELDRAMNMVVQNVNGAFKAGVPYCLFDVNDQKLIAQLRASQLHKLIIVNPSNSGNLGDVMEDYVNVLAYFHDIKMKLGGHASSFGV